MLGAAVSPLGCAPEKVLCRGILDSMEKQLGLSPSHLVPSRETLRRYGNTSSSSIW
jgi:hypothetical protein